MAVNLYIKTSAGSGKGLASVNGGDGCLDRPLAFDTPWRMLIFDLLHVHIKNG